ncbi:hypothetical protein PG357_03845 [Riemerella anatipestifer]|nr:hypothetical protein [Riemerella anatipestifer]
MSKYISEQKSLQNIGILFNNLTEGTPLATELAEYGYTKDEIEKGKALYTQAQNLYQTNIREGQEETQAYANFKQELDLLNATYATDRKKARIIYKENLEVLNNLRLKGRPPYALASLLENIGVFYNTLKAEESLRTPLQRLKVTETTIEAQLAQLTKTEKAYAAYIQEKGESQQATKYKNEALTKVDKWVREFYSIAKIALEDKPQLLESLAKFVRS